MTPCPQKILDLQNAANALFPRIESLKACLLYFLFRRMEIVHGLERFVLSL